jgi:hypothetical protein
LSRFPENRRFDPEKFESGPQALRQAVSGPIEALKGFFAALEAGDSVAACSYVYTTSYGMSFVTWGVISIYNLVGRTRFYEMRYRETFNDGSRARVYVRGKMDYGDQLGMVVNRYQLDGEAELRIQDGAWKVFSLPPYTHVGTDMRETPGPSAVRGVRPHAGREARALHRRVVALPWWWLPSSRKKR